MRHYILIDQSGSMYTRWSDTLGAVNSYAEGIVKSDKKKHKFTVAAFDSSGGFTTRGGLRFVELRRNVKKAEWTEISSDETSPSGGTPLFDAIGRMADLVAKDDPKRAAVIIVTDGGENSSQELSKAAVKAIIAGWEEKEYDVSFLGADFDAFGEAHQIGVSVAKTLNMKTINASEVGRMMALKSVAYGATGARAAYTDDERDLANK